MFVYQSIRTNLPWWWEVCIHLCLFYTKTTVLIRKEGRKKKNGAITRKLILAKEKKYVYRRTFMLWGGTTISDFKHEPFQSL